MPLQHKPQRLGLCMLVLGLAGWTFDSRKKERRDGSLSSNTTVDATPLDRQLRRRLQDNPLPLPSIIGGIPADPDEFQFFVQGEGAGCGGSLIWHDIVLTAAHCILPNTRFDAWGGDAIIGSYKRGKLTKGAERIKVQRAVRHPAFRMSTVHHDYGIAWLAHPVCNKRQFAKLNRRDANPAVNATLTVTGFGLTSLHPRRIPSILRKVNVPVTPFDECQAAYVDAFFKLDNKTQFCAGKPGKDACNGDSGGPIMDAKGRQVGIVSAGFGCGSPEYPGIYSRVSTQRKWIWKRVCQFSQRPPLARCRAVGRKRRARRLKHGATKALEDLPHAKDRSPTLIQCHDTQLLFDFGNKVRNKDCQWLSNNSLYEGEDLCDYDHIAFRCPTTCSACGMFDDEYEMA